jgi:paraquat-inducible protein B
MSKQASKTVNGGFVVGALILVIAGVLVFGSGKFFKKTNTFVLYFESSVSGLYVGAPVVFRGVKIGSVKSITLHANLKTLKAKIPVIIETQQDKIQISEEIRRDPHRNLSKFIEKGLRAQLTMESLVTGNLMIELDFYPDKPVRVVKNITDYPEIPTIPSAFEQITKKLKTLPIEEIFSKLTSAIEGIDKIVNSPQIKEIFDSIHLAVADARRLVQNADKQIDPLLTNAQAALGDARKLLKDVNRQIKALSSDIRVTVGDYGKLAKGLDREIEPLAIRLDKTQEIAQAALEQVRKTLATAEASLDAESPLVYDLESTLKEISAMARSFRLLADYLKRHPNSLIMGKSRPGGN